MVTRPGTPTPSGSTTPPGQELEPPSLSRWRALVDRDLRGADFARRLVHTDEGGLSTQPLYTAADRPPLAQVGAPGQAPWVRGARQRGGWSAWQALAEPDPARARDQAAEELACGAQGLHLVVDASGQGDRGLRAPLASDLHRLLRGLPLSGTWISLEPGPDFLPVAAAFLLALRREGLADGDARGVLGADPVGVLASTGDLPGGSRALSWLGDLAAYCARQAPGLRAAVADGSPWHEAGASDADQLALVLATGVTYLRAVEGAGLGMREAFAQVSFRLVLGPEVFQGIAQVRALRGLWGRVAEACGLPGDPAGAAFVHVLPGQRALTRRDPWVNLLRSTVVTFAGAAGGADAITSLPLDAAIGLPDDRSRRLARNTQTILAAEAHLGRVADPAGGSFFIERRTAELMEAAWVRFRSIEARGGVIPTLCDGTIRGWLDETWAERQRRVATRKRAITGVSEFPLVDEPVLPTRQRDAAPSTAGTSPSTRAADVDFPVLPEPGQGWLMAGLVDALPELGALVPLTAVTEALSVEGALLSMEPLPRRRLAEPFEALRDRSDAWLARHGARPAVFLATLGDPAEHDARATFTCNLLAAGGLSVAAARDRVDPAGLGPELVRSGCRVAVLCGSDERYGAQGAEAARALVQAGATAVWLAGRPGADEAALREAGVVDFLFLGADVVRLLERIWVEVSR